MNPRLKRIAAISLPIVGGMVSQNVLNLVDTAMVGSLGSDALAAVSTASFTNFMCIAAITGLSSGVQALSARRYGEGAPNAARPLNAGLLVAVVVGLPSSVLLWWLAPWGFPFVNDDPDVVVQAVPYLQARLAAMVAVSANFAFRGYWNGVDESKRYMTTLVVMHTANIAISYVLIFGLFGVPAMGSVGAGIGTAAATWLGTAIYVGMGLRHARDAGFLQAMPTVADLRGLAKLALPSSVQQFMFAAGLTLLFRFIGQVGTTEVAAAGVLMNVSLVAILPAIALGMTSASLVGQALGRRDPEDAAQWAWDVVRVAIVAMVLLGLPMVLAPDLLLGVFLHEPETLDAARPALRFVGATLSIDAVGMVLMQSLFGAGDAKRVMVVAVGSQWLLQLPLVYLVGPVWGYGLLAIWAVQVAQRFLQAVVFAMMWRSGDWKRIEV